MNDQLAELKTFVADLKSERAAQKDKEAREAWTKHVSLSMVFIAVLAAVATQWGGKYSSRVLVALNESTLLQAQASDQWNFYQAKSIKQNLYEVERDQLSKTVATGAAGAALLDPVTVKIKKYEEEKREIKAKAEELEKRREERRKAADVASGKGSGMGMAISILQLAVALGSVCLVTKKRPLWYLSLAFSAGALVLMVVSWTK